MFLQVSSSFIETDADLNLAIRFALAIRFNILSDIFAFYSGLQHRISRNTSILRKSGNSISYKFFSSLHVDEGFPFEMTHSERIIHAHKKLQLYVTRVLWLRLTFYSLNLHGSFGCFTFHYWRKWYERWIKFINLQICICDCVFYDRAFY